MKHILLFGIMASFLVFDALAITKTISTQGYVDNVAATKQNKLSGYSGNAVTYGDAPGSVESRPILEFLPSSIDTTDTSLLTAGAVVSGLNAKQAVLDGPENSVVTYTGTLGGASSRGIYQASGTYNSQTNSLAEVQHLNATVTNAFNALVTCNTYAIPGDTTSDCLLWNVNNLSGTYVPQNQ